MVIRHDEQLKALPDLAEAVRDLTTQIAVNNARNQWISGAIGTAGAIVGCVGTWIVIIKTAVPTH